MLVIKSTGKTFLEAKFDKKYGMALDSINDLVICCMGYEEFETVAGCFIEDTIYDVIDDVKYGRADTFKEFEDLVKYMCRNYI